PVPDRAALCLVAGRPPGRRARPPPPHPGLARHRPASPRAHHGRGTGPGPAARPRNRGSVAARRSAPPRTRLTAGRWPAGGRAGRRRRGAGLPPSRRQRFSGSHRRSGGGSAGRASGPGGAGRTSTASTAGRAGRASRISRAGEPADDLFSRHRRQPLSTEVPPEELPRDVVVARTLNAHLRALMVLCGLCVVLTFIGAAALQLAGGDSLGATSPG